MGDIDRKLADAVALVEEIGYRWTGNGWHLPHVSKLSRERRLSIIDIGDKMHDLLRQGGDFPEGWLSDLWAAETSYSTRHVAEPDREPTRRASP